MLPIARNKASLAKPGYRHLSTERSYLQLRRRLKNKEILQVRPDLDAPQIKFPNERLGCQLQVNWRFARYGVVALGENAFRNLHKKHLEMYCVGKADQHKSLHITTDMPAPPETYFVQTGHFESLISSSNKITGDQWRALMAQVTSHLSDSESLFMTDGAVGDNTEVETRVRVISKDPNASLYLKNVLAPTTGSLLTFHHHVVAYHAPDFVLEDPESVGISSKGPIVVQMLLKGSVAYDHLDPEKKAAISPEEKEALADKVAGCVIVFGTNSLPFLRSAITTMTDYFNVTKSQLPLHASTFKNQKDQYTLVFDPSDTPLPSKNLVTSEHCIWTPAGLVNSFIGVTHSDFVPQKGALVASTGKSQRVTTTGQRVSSAQPSAIVFLVDDPSKTIPLVGNITDPIVAAAYFVKYGGYDLSVNLKNQAAKGFEQLLKAKVHVINTNSQTIARRDELVTALSEGYAIKEAQKVTALH